MQWQKIQIRKMRQAVPINDGLIELVFIGIKRTENL